jgi:hypothetical protein
MASALTLPQGVTTIGNSAFYNCKKASSLVIPGSVTSIGTATFAGCEALQSVTIEAGAKTLDFAYSPYSTYRAFYNSSIGTLRLLRNISYNTNAPFEENTKLTSLIIGDRVTSIGASCFRGCTGLTSVTNNATTPQSINSNVFQGVSIGNIPLSVPAGSVALYQAAPVWKDFLSINETAPSTPTASGTTGTLTWEYFSDNSTLTIGESGAMPNYDGAAPWENYKDSITAIVVQEGVTSIGQQAFFNCTALTSVTLPNSLTVIEGGAFWGCGSLSSITLPSSLITISQQAFDYCSSLTSLTIPASVTDIGLYAFTYCTGLTSVTNLAATPQVISPAVFANITLDNVTLTVPAGSVELYQAAPVWQDFSSITANRDGAVTPPLVTTLAATHITQTTATLNKTVTAGTEPVIEEGFRYKKAVESEWQTAAAGDLTGLTAGTEYQFYAFATTASGTVSGHTLTFTTVDGTDATETIAGFALYPSPVENELHIQSAQPVEKVEIVTLAGRRVLSVTNSTAINVSQLPKGIYIVKIFAGRQSLVKKIIKK